MWQKQHFARKCLKSRPFEAPTIAIETTRPGESKNQGPGARFTGRFFGGGQPARGRAAAGRPEAGQRPADRRPAGKRPAGRSEAGRPEAGHPEAGRPAPAGRAPRSRREGHSKPPASVKNRGSEVQTRTRKAFKLNRRDYCMTFPMCQAKAVAWSSRWRSRMFLQLRC